MKKVIVIGGAGYVGTHLVDELIKKKLQGNCIWSIYLWKFTKQT